MEVHPRTCYHLREEDCSLLEEPVLGFSVKLVDAQLEDLQSFSPLGTEKKSGL